MMGAETEPAVAVVVDDDCCWPLAVVIDVDCLDVERGLTLACCSRGDVCGALVCDRGDSECGGLLVLPVPCCWVAPPVGGALLTSLWGLLLWRDRA